MAQTDRELKKALLAELEVSPQRLSQRVKSRKAELPMSTPGAAYTIAFDTGIDISKFLTVEETEAVRYLVAQLHVRQGGGEPKSATRPPSKGSSKAPKPALVSLAGVKIERLPGMSAAKAREAKTMSEKVYPTIYVFENSARELIAGVLRAEFGEDWWQKVVPRRVRDAAQERKDGEGDDPWHGGRGASMIDYTLLSDLPGIVNANDTWPHFKPIFVRKSFFEELVNDFNVSGRVSAHMNPISVDDRKHLEAAFRKWSATLKAKKEFLP